MSCGCGCGGAGACGGSSWTLVRSGPTMPGVIAPQPLEGCIDPEPLGATSDCTLVLTADGLDSRTPCPDGVCLPWHVTSWNTTARAHVEALEAAATTPEQTTFAAEYRRWFNQLDTDVPSPWSLAQRVGDYVLLSQQAACALRTLATGGGGGGGGGGGEDPGSSLFPSLPSLPSMPSISWPSLPSLPSLGWPTIPDWVYWAGGGALLLYLFTRGKGGD